MQRTSNNARTDYRDSREKSEHDYWPVGWLLDIGHLLSGAAPDLRTFRINESAMLLQIAGEVFRVIADSLQVEWVVIVEITAKCVGIGKFRQ